MPKKTFLKTADDVKAWGVKRVQSIADSFKYGDKYLEAIERIQELAEILSEKDRELDIKVIREQQALKIKILHMFLEQDTERVIEEIFNDSVNDTWMAIMNIKIDETTKKD